MKEKKILDLIDFPETCKKLFPLHAHKSPMCCVPANRADWPSGGAISESDDIYYTLCTERITTSS